jgi:branched-chain amino acid transport system substrate-binding protein
MTEELKSVKSAFCRILATLTLVALAVSVGGPLAAQPKPYIINVILPLTGVGANLGQDEANALGAFEKYVNRTGGIRGTPVHFQIADEQSQPAVAVQLFQQILTTHPAVVLGSALVAQDQAMAPLVTAAGPVLYALTPNYLPPPGGFIFAASATTRDLNAPTINYLRARGLTRYATIVTNDASGQNNLQSVDAAMDLPENKAAKIVDRESFALGDISIAAQAARIKASGAQAVFALPNGTAFGTALHSMFDVGLDVPVFTSAANFSPSLLNQYKAFLPKELLASGPSFFNRDRAASDPLKKPIDDFYAALAGDGINVPVATHAFAWDPAFIVVTALRDLGTSATAVQIRDYIEKLRHFAGVQGMYDFGGNDQHGLGVSGLLVLRSDPDHPGHALVVSKQGGLPL